MEVNVTQDNLIKRLNFILDTMRVDNASTLLRLVVPEKLLIDETIVSIDIGEYISLIEKLNNLIKEKSKIEKCDFLVSIQELLERFALEVRICTSCLSLMIQGYVIDGGMDYYCCDECLEKDMTLEEFEKAYGDGSTDTYWTEWH